MARQTILRKEVDIDKCFPEDAEDYYQLGLDYINQTTEDFEGAFELSKRAWEYASRWSNLQAEAGKLAKMNGYVKTDLSALCQQRYRQCHLIHEHCRMIWRSGVEMLKWQPNR